MKLQKCEAPAIYFQTPSQLQQGSLHHISIFLNTYIDIIDAYAPSTDSRRTKLKGKASPRRIIKNIQNTYYPII